jgi:hypothetical protein
MAKVFLLRSYVIQYRRIVKLGTLLPDGMWHDRGEPVPTMEWAQERLAAVRKVPGSACFEYRISVRNGVASKAIAA